MNAHALAATGFFGGATIIHQLPSLRTGILVFSSPDELNQQTHPILPQRSGAFSSFEKAAQKLCVS
jgi:hypothetical protein